MNFRGEDLFRTTLVGVLVLTYTAIVAQVIFPIPGWVWHTPILVSCGLFVTWSSTSPSDIHRGARTTTGPTGVAPTTTPTPTRQWTLRPPKPETPSSWPNRARFA